LGLGAESSARTGGVVAAIETLVQNVAAKVTAIRTASLDLLRQPVARSRGLILLASALVCVYAVSVLWYALGIPEIGLRCAFGLDVQRALPGFFDLPKGKSLHDLEGMRIVRLDGRPVESWPQLLRSLRDLPDDQPVRVDLEDPDHTSAVSLLCRPAPLPLAVLAPSILWFFLKLGLLAVGALVFWKRPEDRSAARFFWLCIVTFGAYLGGYHWSRILTQPVLLLVFMVCGILLPAVSLHFYLVFPRPKRFLQRRPGWALLAIYGPPVLFLLTLLTGYLRVRWLFHADPQPGNVAALNVLLREILLEIYAYFAVAALWYLAIVVSLGLSYATARDATERNQVKWILYGAALAMVPIYYTLYLAFRERDEFSGGAGTWPMFLASAFLTVAFTISITRYRLMQLDQLLGSGMNYFLLSSLAGLVYYGVVFVATWLFSQWLGGGPNLTGALGVSTAALVLLLVLDFLRGRVRRALDRRFYRQKHQLDRTLKRLSQAIEKLVDPPVLARRMLQEVADVLGVHRGAIYLRAGNPPLYRLADHLGEAPPLTELSPGCPLIEALPALGTVQTRPRPATEDAAQRQLRFLGGELAHALLHEGQLLALLVLGPREAGPYTADDLNLVEAFAQITGLALVSAEGHRTIEALNRDLQAKVEKIAEQQRRILALQSQLTKQSPVLRPSSLVPENGAPPAEQPPGTKDQGPRTRDILGSSPQVRDLLQLVRKVSDSQANVLILGESGTGKELLARALHEHSPRAGKAFVTVHCAALSPTLLESELFGHVKGAFTGAHRDKVGRFESADGGTLFLDEIGDIALEVQTKLLRVLEARTFERVGSSQPQPVDVRVLAATHRSLEQLIREGRFREDLYYRLNVISIAVPPLRERREDVPELAQHFLRLYAQRCGRPVTQIDDDALAALKAYPWPGNVRQLENVVQRAVVVAEGATLTLRDLPPELLDGLEDLAPPATEEEPAAELSLGVQAERAERDRREREQLVRALAATDGNKAEAARVLGLARSTLISRLKKHGLQ
jgi:DNA-binding NtrC family response regulator